MTNDNSWKRESFLEIDGRIESCLFYPLLSFIIGTQAVEFIYPIA